MQCPDASVANVSAADYAKMPSTIDSEDPLLNVGKKELQQALRMAYEHVWVADWLFADPAHIFHPKTAAIPPEAFDNSLAIHIQNEISTPAPCAQEKRNVLERQKKLHENPFTVRKDIDLLLVPVLNVNGITVGYSFLNGVQEASVGMGLNNASNGSDQAAQNQFIAGRFSFDTKRRDFLMVVNSVYPHMTGIVSMRWKDTVSRERSFFAIPKADYGPGNLPSRVLSVQCNIDYEVPHDAPQDYQFNHVQEENTAFEMPPSTPPLSTASSSSDEQQKNDCEDRCNLVGGTEDVFEPMERDFTNHGDVDEEAGTVNPDDDPVNWFRLDENADFGEWGAGLESIGTVISPGEDGVLPEALQDFTSNQNIMDDVDRIFGDSSDIVSRSGSASGTLSSDGSDGHSSTSSLKRRISDDFALSPIVTPTSPGSPVPDLGLDLAPSVNPDDTSWIFNTKTGTPDGVGVPRQPGNNDTSSGAFDMGTLLGSLATIERSLKGHFFGPKVRKDILHPLTGELISRCTGTGTARLNAVDPLNLTMLRSIAAQSYYSSLLSVSNDSRLISAQPASGPFFVSPQGQIRQPTDEPKRKQGRMEPKPRPAPAPLAPRPMPPAVALPPGLPHPEVLQIPDTASGSTNPTMDEQAAKEAKLEAKRIKNRLSAARSNQKRRAQLESQKKELAALRERVAELKSKQQLVAEENENLKRQVLSRS